MEVVSKGAECNGDIYLALSTCAPHLERMSSVPLLLFCSGTPS